MIRLLISLYLVVFVSIVLINQSSELIWNSWVHQAPDELRHAQLVAKVLQESVSDIHQLPPQVTTLSSDDVAWLPEQIAALQQGDVITTFTEQGDALLTFQIKGEESLA